MIAANAVPLAEIVLGYLRAHPAASDSVRGIREWWLHGLEPPPTDAQVLEALDRLLESGQVRRIVNPDGGVLWAAGASLSP